MAYLLYYALNREGQSIRRLGQYAALQDLDKELHLQGEELVDFHMLSDGVGKLLESLRGKPKPLEIAEFCTTLSHYVAGGVERHHRAGTGIRELFSNIFAYTLPGSSVEQFKERSVKAEVNAKSLRNGEDGMALWMLKQDVFI